MREDIKNHSLVIKDDLTFPLNIIEQKGQLKAIVHKKTYETRYAKDALSSLKTIKQRMFKDAYTLQCCGLCGYFYFSGMMYQRLDKTTGYCLWKKRGKNLNPLEDTIPIINWCSHYVEEKYRKVIFRKWELSFSGKQGKPALDGIETNFEIRNVDSKLTPEFFLQLPRNPIYIILDNLRSAFNVGSIFRISDAILIKELILCGVTACPPHPKLTKTALGTTETVPYRYFANTTDALDYVRSKSAQIIALETTSISKPHWEITYNLPIALILGNEALGISKEILKQADIIVELQMNGYKNSINVATACSAILFEILRQQNVN